MTTTDYNVLFALSLATLALLVVPPIARLFQLDEEGARESEAARRRIAARQAVSVKLPAVTDNRPDRQEQT